MALQSIDHLSMVALSVSGDVPPHSLQPPIRDGIHLRWSFPPERGFPWHGYYMFRRDPTGGAGGGPGDWERVSDSFKYPLCLPVFHPQYPCRVGQPNEAAAKAIAFSRILYGSSAPFDGQPFTDLHDELVRLVEGGPNGPAMASVGLTNIPGVPAEPDPAFEDPVLASFRTLEWLTLAALNPAIAEMLGLHFVDQQVMPGQTVDYLIVADHAGELGGSLQSALAWVNDPASDYDQADGWVVSGVTFAASPALTPPTGLQAFALPALGSPFPDPAEPDRLHTAGLRWNVPESGEGTFDPDVPVFYHLWRADNGASGETPPATQPPLAAYVPVGENEPPGSPARQILVPDPSDDPALPEGPANWPPDPLLAFDGGRVEGWYSYRLSGVDIFGRHSAHSDPAAWHQWTPQPEPRPWYYVGAPSNQQVHPWAVGLLDKIGPPPPADVEAWAMDPADPYLFKDARYDAWFTALPAIWQGTLPQPGQDALVGLRVRWRWTQAQAAQAPDAAEFRIYLRQGRFNKLLGRVTAVAPAGAGESTVTTDISNAAAANAYAGAVLQIVGDSYRILGSDAGDPLVVRVENLGSGGDKAPAAGQKCTVVVPETLDLFVDATERASWPERIHVVDVADSVGTGFQPITDPNDEPLEGAAATVAGSVVTLDGAPDLSGVQAGADWLYLENDTLVKVYLIVDVDDGADTVTLAGTPALSGSDSPWAIGSAYEQYDVLLPLPTSSTLESVIPEPGLDEPLLFAQVGLGTADDKSHSLDDPAFGGTTWGDRPGNEGVLVAPREIFRVRRLPPPKPPAYAPDSDKVFATRADYRSESFHTFRWIPTAGYRTHVFRALDNALFRADFTEQQSFPRAPLALPGDDELFPPEWDAAKKAQVAAELNQLFTDVQAAADFAAALPFYEGLSNDGSRVFAGLSELFRAYQQVTIVPLDPDDPANADVIGPDDPLSYVPDPGLRAYRVTLDGRARNRYFFRAVYVDGAQNVGEMGLSGVPVCLFDVVPPRAPRLISVLGGDRVINVTWAAVQEPDVDHYRVYRTNDEAASRDRRLMTLVHSEPAGGGAEIQFADSSVDPLTNLYYRVTAVDAAANESEKESVVVGRAFDDSRPDHPAWNPIVINPTSGAATLTWTSAVTDLTCLVQRSPVGAGAWQNLSGWLPRGQYDFVDTSRTPATPFDYRLRVMDTQGRTNAIYLILTG